MPSSRTAPSRTKIVCTLGPASRDVSTLFRMAQAGMDVARLNFSHGTYADHTQIAKHVVLVGKRIGSPIAVLQDLQGPKIRVGDLPPEGVKLAAGSRAVFATGSSIVPGDIPVTLDTLHRDIAKGQRILLDDGLLEVAVERVEGRRILTSIVQGGTLTSHKGMNLPTTRLKLPALSDKDRADAAFGVKLGVDYIALSFVRSADDVRDMRRLLESKGARGKAMRVIAKIEKQEAVDRFDEILPLVDGVMIARGDLGIETPAARVPVIQKQLIEACRQRGVPVIVATQMLDSMIRNPRPTRAEVSDVANAVTDHADAVMLSGETATGAYPVEAVRVMAETIRETEASRFDDVGTIEFSPARDVPEAVGATVRMVTEALARPPIVIATATGLTAREVSAFRPEVPIYAVTFDERVQRALRLVWGVEAFLLPRAKTPEKMLKQGIEFLHKQRKLARIKRVIAVMGSSDEKGSANTISILTI